MNHDLCHKFLVATRHVVRQDGRAIDTGFGVTHTSDRRYWLVQDAHGKTMWEGDACCAYVARTKALMKFADVPEDQVREQPSFKRFAKV
jgi:hypothetical protein